MQSIRAIVHCHHERIDGKGYPNGLKGENIPFEARIVSIADAWDAMTSDRSYRKGMTMEQALRELQEHSGEQFDAHMVRSFIAMVKNNPPLFASCCAMDPMQSMPYSVRNRKAVSGVSGIHSTI